jgi:hypothetical protein
MRKAENKSGSISRKGNPLKTKASIRAGILPPGQENQHNQTLVSCRPGKARA